MKIGITELILVAIVAFVVIGPDKLPEYARKLGKMLRELKKYTGAASEEIQKNVVEPLNEIQAPIKEAVAPLTDIKKDIDDSMKDVTKSFTNIGKTSKEEAKKAEEAKKIEEAKKAEKVESPKKSKRFFLSGGISVFGFSSKKAKADEASAPASTDKDSVGKEQEKKTETTPKEVAKDETGENTVKDQTPAPKTTIKVEDSAKATTSEKSENEEID